ncbi:hypothetical protein [Maribacter sp. MJ134]|nr:hypothetical protein [Maribacter sp. MJ134]
MKQMKTHFENSEITNLSMIKGGGDGGPIDPKKMPKRPPSPVPPRKKK